MTRAIRVQGIAEFLTGPDLEFHIAKHLPKGGIGAIIGPSGSAKTHLALDIGLTSASGLPLWLDRHPIKSGRVVYLIAEGRPGLRQRIRAWQRAHPGCTPDFYVIPDAVQLMDVGDVADMIAAVVAVAGTNIALLFLDTWSKVTPGAEENSRMDTGLALAAADRLREAFNCTVIIVHHTGGNPEKSETPRGSTAFLAHMDWVWLVRDKEGLRTVTCTKMRDAEAFEPFQFKLRAVAPSCVIEPVAFDAQAATVTSLDRSARAALVTLDLYPEGMTAKEWMATTSIPSSTFYKARTTLVDRGLVVSHGSQYKSIPRNVTPTPSGLHRDSIGSESSTPSLSHSFRSGVSGVTDGGSTEDEMERLAIEQEAP